MNPEIQANFVNSKNIFNFAMNDNDLKLLAWRTMCKLLDTYFTRAEVF